MYLQIFVISWKYSPLENLPQASCDNGGKLTVGVNNIGGHTFSNVYNDRSDTGVNDAGG